jgi:hypothetical protein
MTDQTKAIQTEVKQTSEVQLIARGLAQRLKYMIVNGNKLSDNEVFSLAQYAASTGLDPLAQECWYIPTKGPGPGIAGWRRKAQEQLEYEAQLSGEKDPGYIWTSYENAQSGECVFDPQKDIAYKVILRDSRTQKIWRDSLKETIAMLREALQGFNATPADFWKVVDEAKKLIGDEPIWIGYGVVFGDENFGKGFDRHERAKKRGEKLALRKRFPRLRLPEPVGVDDVVDSEDYNVVMQEPEKLPEPRKTVEENLTELGFEPDQKPEKEPKNPKKQEEVHTVTSNEFWTVVKEKGLSNLAGQDILNNQGGDFNAAMHELNKK